MYISQKISITIDEKDIGYLYWYAKRYTAAIKYSYKYFFRLFRKYNIKSLDQELKKKILNKHYQENRYNLEKYIAVKYQLHSRIARKAVNDGYKLASDMMLKGIRKLIIPQLKYQISGSGLRDQGFMLFPEAKKLVVSYKYPKGTTWKFKRAIIELRIRTKVLNRIKKAMEQKLEVTGRLVFLSKKKAYFIFSANYPDPREIPENKGFYLGFDINYDRITASLVKSDGNPIYFRTIKIRDIKNKTRRKKIEIISQALEKIFNDLKQYKFTVILEDLSDLKNKFNPRYPRTIIAYRLIQQLILNKCAKNFIPVRFIDQRFTTQLAKKYKGVYKGRSNHELAAFVIARRYIIGKEKLPIDLAKFKTMEKAVRNGYAYFS